MKLICSKSNLLQGVNIVSKAVPSKTTMSILECILIDATTGEIKLTANDMELGIETKIQGDIINRGIVAIDAKIFSEIIRKLPDNDVYIETDENFVTTITCEKAIFKIAGKSGEDFSYLPVVEKNKYIYMSQFTLKETIRQTIFSIADNNVSNSVIMTGELFNISQNQLEVVSSDMHRISIRRVEMKDSFDDIKVIVPGKTLSEIIKILNGGMDDEVRIFFTKNHIVFEFDDTVVVSRLIEGDFLRVNQIISNDFETKIGINKKEFLSCIERATLLVKENDRKPIIINITDGELELKISSILGSMNENIDISKDGKDIIIGMDPKFLIDALKVIDDEEINLYFVNQKAPCYIKDKDNKYIYLILPVNI